MILHDMRCQRKHDPVVMSDKEWLVTGSHSFPGTAAMGVLTVKIHQAVYLGRVHLSVCVIYFNKKF